ncbi:hypothetical protein TCDM_06377 [Trypanosoma cruzi Dm28c]|uniref:Uncharacterized protein n=1 Tax=Trypanosoma cruzi Dm28c TaxID=1416333 RepID=V5BL60_TRYCR|nr:hypothetical protein TCDM_06377 [Trypanosoma cruzi Dm28c]
MVFFLFYRRKGLLSSGGVSLSLSVCVCAHLCLYFCACTSPDMMCISSPLFSFFFFFDGREGEEEVFPLFFVWHAPFIPLLFLYLCVLEL